jgi:hypothetical protein
MRLDGADVYRRVGGNGGGGQIDVRPDRRRRGRPRALRPARPQRDRQADRRRGPAELPRPRRVQEPPRAHPVRLPHAAVHRGDPRPRQARPNLRGHPPPGPQRQAGQRDAGRRGREVTSDSLSRTRPSPCFALIALARVGAGRGEGRTTKRGRTRCYCGPVVVVVVVVATPGFLMASR